MNERAFACPRRIGPRRKRCQSGLDRLVQPILLSLIDVFQQARSQTHFAGNLLQQLLIIDLPTEQSPYFLGNGASGRSGLAR